jgi:hypothetical protein
MLPGPPSTQVSVDALMREIEGGVRTALRNRIVARGGPSEYADDEVFAAVEALLRRALERRDPELLLPALSDDERRLVTHLHFSSHRPVVGPAVIFLKRHVLLPLMRWLYEYSLENFRRQEQINSTLFACVEELAIENVRLRRDLQRLAGRP